MIEVVKESITTSKLHEDQGTFGAFDDKSIMNYLKANNKDSMLEIAIDNFHHNLKEFQFSDALMSMYDGSITSLPKKSANFYPL